MEEHEIKTRLQAERIQRHWAQHEVAEAIEVSLDTYARWERGYQAPRSSYYSKLTEHFGIPVDASWFAPFQNEERPVQFQNIPFLSNPYFLQKEGLLGEIHQRLTAQQAPAHILCLQGLGGIGKTQVAIEYARCYHPNPYRVVLWMNAETQEQYDSDLVKSARQLHVPESKKQKPNYQYMLNEMKQWLREHSGWLLILDNVEQDIKIEKLLISIGDQGHILITTRERRVADLTPNIIELEPFSIETGALFLLRRAQMIQPSAPLEDASPQEQGYALTLSRLLGGLPLALEQAGAYIHETQCGLAGYIQEFQTSRSELLRWRSEHKNLSADYGETVATTWLISFKRVEHQSKAASHLLHLYAFLRPDAIPEDIVLRGGQALEGELHSLRGNTLSFNRACQILLNYSLIHRNATGRLLAVHRLVQAVLQDRLSDEEQKQWAEKAVLAVNQAMTEATKEEYEQYLPHARCCAKLIRRWELNGEQVAHLLERTALALSARGYYAQATSLYQQTLGALQNLLGEKHPRVLQSLLNVAQNHVDRGIADLALLLYRSAYQKYEATLGFEHPLTMRCLSYMAQAFLKAGNAEQAIYMSTLVEDWYHRLQEPESVELAMTHQVTAEALDMMGHSDPAEPHCLCALAMYERLLGPEHPEVVRSLIDVGSFYLSHDDLDQAEKYFQRAKKIQEHTSIMDHPETARLFSRLAEIAYRRGAYSRAEELVKQTLSIRRQKLGRYHPTVVESLCDLAITLAIQRKDEEAEQMFREAQEIVKDAGGEESFQNFLFLQSYIYFLQLRGRAEEAESYKKQLETRLKRIERNGGPLLSFDTSYDDEDGTSGRGHIWILK